MKRVIGIVLCLALVLLCGCGAGKTDNALPEETPVPVETPAVAAEEAEPADPRPERIRMVTKAPASLDPVNAAGTSCLLEIYEPLFDRAELGGELRAVLADESRGTYRGFDHEQGTAVYTVYLRAGLTDHAGNALTAADAAFCYNRIGAQKTDWPEWGNAEAVDDTTVHLNLTKELAESSALTKYLLDIYLYTEKSFNDNAELAAKAVGTGPYRMSEYSAGESLRVEVNDAYWGGEQRLDRAGANVKSIEYLFSEEAADTVIALETNKADMADSLDYLDTEDFRGDGSYTDLYRVELGWSHVNHMMIPNVSWQSVVKETGVRAGVFSAIDKAAIADCFGVGGGRGCTGIGNPDNPDAPAAWAEMTNYQTATADLITARNTLRGANYVNESITVLVIEGTPAQQIADAMQTMLMPMSITIHVSAVEAATFETTMAGEAGWDFAILPVEASSMYEVIRGTWLDALNTYNITRGGLRDAKFASLLRTLEKETDRTEENYTALWQHALDNALVLSLPQKCCPVVVPVSATQVYLTGNNELLPGACIYG